MPYSIDWLIPNQIIYAYFSGVLEEDEVREALKSILDMIKSSDYPYVHIIDDTGDITMPLSPKKMLEISRELIKYDRLGWSLIIREKSMLVKMGVAFGSSVIKSKVRSFSTFDEAAQFLREVDVMLDWSHMNSELGVKK